MVCIQNNYEDIRKAKNKDFFRLMMFHEFTKVSCRGSAILKSY